MTHFPTAALILGALVFAASSDARADDWRPVDHRVRVMLGYGDLTILDRAATSLPYHGTVFDVDLAYVEERRRMRWWIEVGTSAGPYGALGLPGRAVAFASENPAGEVERLTVPMRGLAIMPRVHTGVQYKWTLAWGAVSLLLGGEVNWDVRYPQGFVTPGLMQVLSLQPSFAVQYRPAPRHELELGTRLAVLGWVTRMPWHQTVSLPGKSAVAGWIEQGSRVASLDTFQSVGAEATYRFRFRPRWSLEARYVMGWMHDAVPRGLQSFEHRLSVGMAVHW